MQACPSAAMLCVILYRFGSRARPAELNVSMVFRGDWSPRTPQDCYQDEVL